MAQAYFAGVHTGRGYEHFLEQLRPEGEGTRVCVVRGALGTGREVLLGRLADTWTRMGRAVTRYEGAEGDGRLIAVVSGEWAALDGAAPHMLEALPGERTVDLSAALELDALKAERAEAMRLYQRMRGLHRRAWRCLQVAHTAWSDSAAIYVEAVDAGALCNLRMELIRWMDGSAGKRQPAFGQAVTAAGVREHLDSLEREHMVCLDLPWGFDPDSVLYPVSVALQTRGMGARTVMQPLDGGRLNHLCTESHAAVCFCETGKETRSLPLDAAVLRREQDALAFNRAAYDLWLRQGMEALAAARECAAGLERLVADAVNRDRQAELFAQAEEAFGR